MLPRPLDFKTFLPSPLEEGVLLCSVECLEYAMDGFHAWESKVNLCRLFEIYDEEDKVSNDVSFEIVSNSYQHR